MAIMIETFIFVYIGRKFTREGDVELAMELVEKSKGLQKCKELAQIHVEKAIESISILEPSIGKESLIALAYKVITRTS